MTVEGQYLLITRAGKPQEIVHLDPAKTYTLGRAPGCQIPLADASISRQHAQVVAREDEWWVQDLQSKNGTKLNGEAIQKPERLKPGDRVEVGPCTLLFSADKSSGQGARIGDTGAPGSMKAVPVSELVGGPGSDTRLQALKALPAERIGNFLQSIDRVGAELQKHRPLSELFQFLVELVSDVVRADRSVILQREHPDDPELTVKAVRYGGSGLGGEIVVSRSIAWKTVEERQAILTGDAMHDPRFMEQQSIIRQRIHSAMCVPLWNENEVLGLLYVDNIAAQLPFTEEDLRLLTLIGHLAAVKIRETEAYEEAEHNRQLQEDLRRAAGIQQGLLPPEPLILEPFEIAGRNLPSQNVGGDYFDFIECEDGRICVGLGDVAGKGMSAALLMANLHASIRAQVETGRPLPAMVARINRSIHQAVKGQRFITLVLVTLDLKDGKLEYVNAGHNPPILLRADGSVERLETGGFLLGVFPEAAYEAAPLQLHSGDLLILYSDGVTEAMDAEGTEFGDERLIDFLGENRALAVEDLVDALIRRVGEYAGKPGDDVTVAAIRRR
jgi:sigma-B regulation protein RsbU (phosphoserine phosphatase)